MEQVKNIVIGFGKAGKTLAAFLAKKGEKTILIEKSNMMYGGTCINVACIPSKSLEYSARISHKIGGEFKDKEARYEKAISKKEELTSLLRKKNYEMVASSGCLIVDGEASFVDEKTVKVALANGKEETYQAERIFINTGSYPFTPSIPGIKDNPLVYTSETMMGNKKLPHHLAILGSGYIGLEFASYYANFGSEVSILQDGHDFIPREDKDISNEVKASFINRGIKLIEDAKLEEVISKDGSLLLRASVDGKEGLIPADALLVATGRRPNVASLHLEKAGIKMTERGAIWTDEHKRTNVPHIYAMGDVSGGMQFTYISLDDFRIVKDDLFGSGARSDANRGAIPYSVFIDPPLSRVGLTEEEAKAKGYNVMVGLLKSAAIPKARVLDDTTGLLKVIVDKDSSLILGAHLFCEESQEIINLLKLAIDQKIPYQVLRDNIYNHPTMSEALNDLFSAVK